MTRVIKHDFLKRFRHSESGAAGVALAIAAPIIIGISGLAIDYGVWKKDQTALQRTTESAALAAAFAKARGATDLQPYAVADARKNGFDESKESLNVGYANGEITVTMSRNSDRYLSAILSSEPLVINAIAAAELEEVATEGEPEAGGYACITALESNPTTQRGIYLHNTASIDATDCGVHSNSVDVKVNDWTEKGSIYVRNGSIVADSIRAVGEAVINSSNGSSTTSVEPENSAPAFIDPFAGMAEPVAGTCDNNGRTVNYVQTPAELIPGTYCGDIIIQNGGKASFAPGLYHLVDGNLYVRGGASIFDSTGVTFFFGGDNPGKWIIDNGTDVSFTAPAVGETAGMLFWQSAEASCNEGYNGQNKFAGGARFAFDGVIYAPNCGLVIDNNAHLTPSHSNAHMSIHTAWLEMRGSTLITAYGAPAEAALVAETGFTERVVGCAHRSYNSIATLEVPAMSKGFLARFRRSQDGSVAAEIGVSIVMLGIGFVGLWTTTNSVRNANAAENMVSDVVMTARAIGDIEERSDDNLSALFNTVANESLMSSQRVDITMIRQCGCPTQADYSPDLCTIDFCPDGLTPARYLDLTFDVGPSGEKERSVDAINNFQMRAAVQY